MKSGLTEEHNSFLKTGLGRAPTLLFIQPLFAENLRRTHNSEWRSLIFIAYSLPCILYEASLLLPLPKFWFFFHLFFTYCPFSVPGSHRGHHITFGDVSLGVSWLWQFLRLSLFLMTITVLRITEEYWSRHHRVSLNWDLLDFSPMTDWSYWHLGGRPQR